MASASLPPLRPPDHMALRPEDEPFWAGILRARARSEWIEADLVVAVQLARCQADIEREQAALDSEGSVLENARGSAVMNPRVSVLEQLSRREMAIMRTLRMGGRVTGPIELHGKRRAAERQAEEALAQVEDEDLLAS